ncbi:MAG: ATP-binding protein [Bacillus sp. (in: firmicutes)]
MVFLRSVVGKLWLTILLLVCFVLLILTVLLLEFFENFNVHQVEDDLLTTANRIAQILEDHEDPDYTLEISSQLLGQSKTIMIVEEKDNVYTSHLSGDEPDISLQTVQNDKALSRIFTDGKIVTKELTLQNSAKVDQDTPGIIVGVPLSSGSGDSSAVFVFQTLDSMKDTIRSTTKFIILAAGVAIVLTTIFAFFLSTRITAPLRKLREAAFEVARGKFDTAVLSPSNDEIGELAIAFNQMGKQLKNNMNALSQEKENLDSILSSMADGVITINIDGSILKTNPPADQLLDYWYHKEQITSHQREMPLELMKLFQLSVDSEQEQSGEIKIGNHYWMIIVSPLYNNQHIRGAVAVLRNMTEERQLDKMRNDFIANVSHELRTPISMLQGYSEAIIDDIAQTEAEKKEMAQVIYDESLRMGRLVNELLDLARMEAGHITLNFENVQLDTYLSRIASKFSGLAKDKHISIITDLEGRDRHWMLDPDRMEQVLTNLIDNAIRHTPERGEVILRQYVNGDGKLVIEVRDSGSGIPAEDLPFVFERFYKADKARTRGQSGTGLGLAIANNIVKAHNGEMSVVSALGEGTTFTSIIP